VWRLGRSGQRDLKDPRRCKYGTFVREIIVGCARSTEIRLYRQSERQIRSIDTIRIPFTRFNAQPLDPLLPHTRLIPSALSFPSFRSRDTRQPDAELLRSSFIKAAFSLINHRPAGVCIATLRPSPSQVLGNLSRSLERAPARRVDKKFAVPAGNEAVTNGITSWRCGRKGSALNGI